MPFWKWGSCPFGGVKVESMIEMTEILPRARGWPAAVVSTAVLRCLRPQAARIPRKKKTKKKTHTTGAQHPNEIVKRYDLLWHQSLCLTSPALCCLLIFISREENWEQCRRLYKGDGQRRCFLIDFINAVSMGEAISYGVHTLIHTGTSYSDSDLWLFLII